MKKLMYSLACLVALSSVSVAAPPTDTRSFVFVSSTVAPADLAEYAGKYKMEGMPFEYITVEVKDGKLMVDANGQSGVLAPLAEADKFDASGQATLMFNRDASQKVVGVTLEAQGMKFEGKKDGMAGMVSMTDYVGKYKMEGMPFEYITVAEKGGKLTVDTGSQNGELIAQPEADKFDASGQAMLKFTRDGDKKVNGVTLEAQGNQFAGKKES